jgi:hypothetical protein
MRLLTAGICSALLFTLAGCKGVGGGDIAPAGLTVSSTSSGGTGTSTSPVPLYALVPDTGTGSLGSGVFRDPDLDNGEIFLMAQDPLVASSTYQVEYTIFVGSTQFTKTWTFDTGTSAVTTTGATGAFAELNALRLQANSPAVTSSSVFGDAATLHSGYQCEQDQLDTANSGQAITHHEPVTTASYFVADDFLNRISIANGGTAPAGSDIFYEVIATNGGVPAVDLLWDTVYHRLGMMRRHITVEGHGERTDAAADATRNPGGTVITGPGLTNEQYFTADLGADSATAQVQAVWPADAQTNVGTTFDTDGEIPDPVGNANGDIQDNGTPDDDLVGTPIHIVLPTSGIITGISVKLTKLP